MLVDRSRFCGQCGYLSPNEKDQTSRKEIHLCEKYGVRVYHLVVYHPEIVRCEECRRNEGQTSG